MKTDKTCFYCKTDYEGETCPSCGAKSRREPQQPPKKKGKGWAIAALVVVGGLAVIVVLITAFKSTPSEVESGIVSVAAPSQAIEPELKSGPDMVQSVDAQTPITSHAQPQGDEEVSASVVQENIYKYSDSIDTNFVLYVAEIKNTSNVPISVSGISIDLEDASGALLNSVTYASANPSDIMPGESFFICEPLIDMYDEEIDLTNVGNAILHYSINASVNFTPPNVTISEVSAKGEGYNFGIVGRIENTGTEDFENLMLYSPIWNAEGKLVSVATGMVDSLKAGEKKGFDQWVIYIDPSVKTENATFEVIPRALQ